MSQSGTYGNNGVFPPGSIVQTLTGNSGGVVGPDIFNNIFILGDGITTDVVGHPLTNDLTISVTQNFASTYTTDDANFAVPALYNLNVFGSHGINTSSAGSTVTIAIDNAITLGDLAAIATGSNALTLTTGDLAVSSGNIKLPSTSAAGADGVIIVNGSRFIHDFGATNVFVGSGSGNFTLTGFSSVALGDGVLASLTSGQFNTAGGFASQGSITSGTNNASWGAGSLSALTTSDDNSAFGNGSLTFLVSGTNNTALGFGSGSAYTTNESNNIVIGNAGVIADSATIRIGTNGVQTSAFVSGIATVATSNSEMVTVDTVTGQLGSTTIPVGGIVTINGDSGSATGATVTIFTDPGTNGGTPVFTASAAQSVLTFTDGDTNTVIGANSLIAGGGGTLNVGLGSAVLTAAVTGGDENTAIGHDSLGFLTTGKYNVALGANALSSITTGSYNCALGEGAASSYNSSESSNISINNVGILGESHVLRIGAATGSGPQELNKAYICGIDGVNIGSVAKVVTMASDQLGTASITAGTGISVTPGANTITIANTVSSFTWAVTTVDAGIVVNNGYIANKAGLLTMTLPATGAIGDIIRITGINTAVGWRIAQNANQQIFFGAASTTLGATGYVEATAIRDSAELVCVVAGASTVWNIISAVGNLTIA